MRATLRRSAGGRPYGPAWRRGALLLLLLLLMTTQIAGEGVTVPVETQLPLLLKILTFDRTLQSRVGDRITIVVLYQRLYRPSLMVKESWQRCQAETEVATVMGIPYTSVYVELGEETDLKAVLEELHADVLYLAPLRAVDLESVTAVSRQLRLLSVAADPEYVEAGVSVGLELYLSRPRIVINLAAARAEGIDFSSGLLNLARVINLERTEQ